MYNYRLKDPQSPSTGGQFFKPAIIVGGLILVVVSIFFLKNLFIQKKDADLQKLLAEKRERAKQVDVEEVTPEQVFKNIRDDKTQLVDIREESEFETKHIESSINLPLSQVNEKINLISAEKQVIIIDRQDSLEGKIFTDHLGSEGVNAKYLKGGILAFAQEGYSLINIGNPTDTTDLLKVNSISAEEIKKQLLEGKLFAFVDTRPAINYSADHIDGSINIPLEELEKRKNGLPAGRILVYDDEQIRSFRAAVRLYDMNIVGVHSSLDGYQILKSTLLEEKPPAETPSQDDSQSTSDTNSE